MPTRGIPARTNEAQGTRQRQADARGTIEVIDLSTDSEEEVSGHVTSSATTPIRQQNDTADPRLSHLKCVICLDSPTDLTATTCGHLFCHECIMAALKASNTTTGSCPVCRRKLTVKSLIPLAILKAPVLGSDALVPDPVATETLAVNPASRTARARNSRKRPLNMLDA